MLVAGLRSRNAADGLLHKLVKDGLVVRIRRGCYVKDFPRETILLPIPKLAEAQGALGIGPIKTAAEVKAAIVKGVSVLKAGGVCVIDFHVEPPPERSDGIGHRATGDAALLPPGARG